MTIPPLPVVFEPLFKPKPWGGRKLATLFQKQLPPEQPIGESWEVVDLPEAQSRVPAGPLAGRTIGDLVRQWGPDFYGSAKLVEGRFPLLIKFLDARESLSVQVHPKPAADDPAGRRAGVKHEAWCILDAGPGAELLLGWRPGVSPPDVERAAGTPAMAGLLRRWPVRAGEFYYLPSGTAHALGADIFVLEVQTPSDITYRLYDWDRKEADGRPRSLHIEQALQNIRYDVPDALIQQPPSTARSIAGGFITAVRNVACEYFQIEKVRINAGELKHLPFREMTLWAILKGRGVFVRALWERPYKPGDVVVLPADCVAIEWRAATDCEALQIRALG